MSLCPDDRGRPHDDRDKSGTQIDVQSTLIVSQLSCPVSVSITGWWTNNLSLYCIESSQDIVCPWCAPLYLHLWPPDYLCRILVLIETSSARPKPSNSELLTIKFRFPDVTEIGVSLLRCQCLAVASSHVNSQGSGGNQFSNIWVPLPLLDVSGNNLIINISLIFPVSSSPTPGIGLLGYQCAVMWRIYPIVGFIVLLDCQFVFQLRQFCQQQQNKTILRTPKHQEKYRGCWGS